jgi:hypothetical protein
MEMAREVKMPYDFVTGEPINIEKLEAFAALVREDEREACAMTAENTSVYDRYSPEDTIADAIRARGEQS